MQQATGSRSGYSFKKFAFSVLGAHCASIEIEAQFWESPFREDSGLPTLALATALTLDFTILYLDFTF